MPKNLTALLAVPLVTVTLITGCSAETSDSADSAKSTATHPQTSPAPTPEETQIPDEITGQPGDPLTAAEAKQLNGQIGTLRPYEMKDGSFVLIDVKQPLPEMVKQEVAERLGSVGNETGNALGALDRETLTGKTIVMVRQIHYSSAYGGNFFGWHAVSYASGFPIGVTGESSGAVVSQIQPWVNSQRDPAQFEIVVVNG
ncbi:hypothetical protein Q9R19_09225 [Microbacterium sp. ARD32]|uniref:hypothetical protein n=1 Tax=Microbacterium sp. ARD32 TaxID=2962577 RepID=UPI0028814575|nr:hypothetical protein [Microbacterium sp. ARD32]MDT0157804.1 hypothetical protein [Microbacterium sp. ARD32]